MKRQAAAINRGKRRRPGVAACIGVALLHFVATCSETVQPKVDAPTPVVERAPIRVAVVYDKALANHHCVVSKGYIAEDWTIAIGPPSTAAFTKALGAMFEKATVLPAAEAGQAAGDQTVIRISLDAYSGCDGSWPIIGGAVDVAYSARVTRGSGVALDGWTGRGRAAQADLAAYPSPESTLATSVEGYYLARLTEIAIRKAVADFIANFEDDPRVVAWKTAAIAEARHD